MHAIVRHRISDPDKFFAMDAEEIAASAPPGVLGKQFLPSRDRSVAVCLWECDSLDALRSYLDPALEGVAENKYFEVDESLAVGLPERAAAGAEA